MSICTTRPTQFALASAIAVSLLAAGCASNSSLLGEKVDYRKAGSKTITLDVPPDLSKLPGQSRYGQVVPPIVSANNLNGSQETASKPNVVAPGQFGAVKLQRSGQTRWITTDKAPEEIWDAVKQFWIDSGFEIASENPAAGVLETSWAENRAKLPQDLVRRTLGSIVDGLYDTGERDQYKVRIEKVGNGSEIYVAHRGVVEEFTNAQKTETRWLARTDDAVESEMIARLVVHLGGNQPVVAEARADSKSQPSTNRPIGSVQWTAGESSLVISDDIATVWRRVGLALDRTGYTIDSRDRARSTFDVKLPVDPNQGDKIGLWSRLMGKKDSDKATPLFRVTVIALNGNQSRVEIQQVGNEANKADSARVAGDIARELQ